MLVEELSHFCPTEAQVLGRELGDSALASEPADGQGRSTTGGDGEMPVVGSALEQATHDRPHVVRVADQVVVVQDDQRPLGRQVPDLREE